MRTCIKWTIPKSFANNLRLLSQASAGVGLCSLSVVSIAQPLNARPGPARVQGKRAIAGAQPGAQRDARGAIAGAQKSARVALPALCDGPRGQRVRLSV
jgi:hypothetical protein